MKTILALMLVASCAFADTSDLEYQMRYNNDLMQKQNDLIERQVRDNEINNLITQRRMREANEQAMWDSAARNRQTVWPTKQKNCIKEVEESTKMLCDINMFQQYCDAIKKKQ